MNDWLKADHKPAKRAEPPAPELDAVLFRIVGASNKPIRCATYLVATGIELRIGYEHGPDAPFETRLFRTGEDEAIAELAAQWRGRFDAEQQMFLNMIDDFTEWHLRLLKLFQDPRAYIPSNAAIVGGLSDIVTHAYPGLHRDFYDQVWRELFLRGLVTVERLHDNRSIESLGTKRTTDRADRFLSFIGKPATTQGAEK